MVLSLSFVDMLKVVKILSLLMLMFSTEVEQGDPFPSCFSSHSVNKHPFHCLFRETFFRVLCFLLLILLFKMAPKQTTKVLSRSLGTSGQ